jgi:type IV pilus assembly protein PilA
MLKTLMKKAKKSKGGFTLIELIVVIAILGILAVVLIPTISGQINNANLAKGKSDVNSAYLAATMALADLQQTPPTGGIDSAAIQTKAADYYKGTMTVTYASNAITAVAITENAKTYTYTPGAATPIVVTP